LSQADQSTEKIFGDHSTEKCVARTVACYRSGMNGYELCDHSHRQTFRDADRLALIFLGAVTRIDEEVSSRQPFSLSYTYLLHAKTVRVVRNGCRPVREDRTHADLNIQRVNYSIDISVIVETR
jgi:hypothetical protein